MVGRLKLNERLGVNESLNQKLLHEDILATVGVLLKLKVGSGVIDDIDHLGNRRVRAVGELLENQYRIGLLRIERAIRDGCSYKILILCCRMMSSIINHQQ